MKSGRFEDFVVLGLRYYFGCVIECSVENNFCAVGANERRF